MKLKKGLFLILSLLLISKLCYSNQIITYNDLQKNISIGKYVSVLIDNTSKLTIKEIYSSKDFIPSNQDVPNLGVTSANIWIKFSIKNNTPKPLLLELAYPIIDEVDFYSISSNGKIKIERAGEILPFAARIYNHPNYIFDLNISEGQTSTFFIRVKGNEQILLPLYMGTSMSIFESIMIKDLIFGIYFGIILVMFLYNLFIYITLKDIIYLYYVVYIISVGIAQTTLQGYTFKYLWPNNIWLAVQSNFLFPALVGFTLISFVKVFLHTRNHTPLLDKLLNILIIIYIICVGLSISGIYGFAYKLIQINGMVTALFLLYVSYTILKRGYKPAKFFLLGWSMFLIGVCIFALKDFGILPFNNFTNYMMQFGSAIEVILLSFALADRINILKKEKEKSQADALRISKENEDIIKRQNIILDIKVTERTEELEKSNDELNITLQNLKDTQSKLVDAEKMASLGQLTAGIAHEINNPINFVSSSIKPLKRDIADIFTILEKYDEFSKDSNIELKIKEVTTLKKELDIDYLKEEISILLSGIDDGANRTAEIVKGLRNFSRMDEDDLKLANVHEGIDSSLVLLNSALGGRIDIIKEYNNIPPIECYAGKLNQVFMNILTNATQAINGSKETQGKGSITIRTFEKGKYIIICIKDSGIGMPEAVKNKIFEPFFTTKDVGEGTGLGLSIVFSIIEAHNGTIEVESEIGKGTEFIITLPKTQKN